MQNLEDLCLNCLNPRGGNSICKRCGFDESRPLVFDQIPPRTMLDARYLIGNVLSHTCSDITYLAWDTQDDTAVRITEFFPVSYCTRNSNRSTVDVKLGCEGDFNRRIEEFLDLARELAEYSTLPSVFPITDIFESNHTAYYASEYVKSISLRDFVQRNGGLLTWDQFRPLFAPVLATLAELNEGGIYHLAISPDSLVVGKDGIVRIVDFTIPDARIAGTDLNAAFCDGYTATECYNPKEKTGSYTDVYGMCATLYMVLVGKTPSDARERIDNDHLVIPGRIAQDLPKNVLTSLADGLAVFAIDRIPTVSELKDSLVPIAAHKYSKKSSVSEERDGKANRRIPTYIYFIITILVTIIVLFIAGWKIYDSFIAGTNNSSSTFSDASAPSESSVSLASSVASAQLTHEVGNYVGNNFSDVWENSGNSLYFKVKVTRQYSSSHAKGIVIKQTPEAGTKMKKDSTIEVVVSLGPEEVTIGSYRNDDKDTAIIKLIKLGFDYNNIIIAEKNDPTCAPEKVVETSPVSGTKVNVNSKITIYINSYREEEEPSESTVSTTSPAQ